MGLSYSYPRRKKLTVLARCLLSFFVAPARVRDLLLRAKHLFVAAMARHGLQSSRGERDRRAGSSITLSSGDTRSPASSLYGAARNARGHLNRSIDGVFEIVRVVGRDLVSIAEVHAIVAGAHLRRVSPRWRAISRCESGPGKA